MCGRFFQHTSPDEWSETRIPWKFSEGMGDWHARFNVAPSQSALVVPNVTEPTIVRYRWGLVPRWAKDLSFGYRTINARSETLASKPSFRDAYKRRRCAVLVDGFYEWQKIAGGKIPTHIRLKDTTAFALAGLWESWQSPEGEDVRSFTVITTAPNELVAPIHNRMPAILHPSDYECWLDADPKTDADLSSMLSPYPADEMEAFAVSSLVNKPANDLPECIKAV
jgi:putative SOS response-associated peptidase YedK